MKRVALFAGINEYRDPKINNLRYAEKDAAQMEKIFSDGGYDTCLLAGKNSLDIIKKVRELCGSLETGDIFTFYFSGHGHETGGQTYLLCSQADSVTVDIDGGTDAVSLSAVRRICQRTAPPGVTRIFILDCCRSHILAGTKGAFASSLSEKGIAMSDQEAADDNGNEVIMLACGDGECAFEDERIGMGNFTKAMLNTVKEDSNRCFAKFWEALVGNLKKITREQKCKLCEYNSLDIPLFSSWETPVIPELSNDEKAEYFQYYIEVSNFLQQLIPPEVPEEILQMYSEMQEQFKNVPEVPEIAGWDVLQKLQKNISFLAEKIREFPSADKAREACKFLCDQLLRDFNWSGSREFDSKDSAARMAYRQMYYSVAAKSWNDAAGFLQKELARCRDIFEKQQEKIRRKKAARERQQMIREALQKGDAALVSCQWDAAEKQANRVLAVDRDNVSATKLLNSAREGRKKEKAAKNKMVEDFYHAGMTALDEADFISAENYAEKICNILPDNNFAAELLVRSRELQERISRIGKELPEYQKLLEYQQDDQIADWVSQDFGILPEELLNEIKKLKEAVLPVIEKRELISSIRKAIEEKNLQTAEKGLEKLRSIAPHDPDVNVLTCAKDRKEKEVLLHEITRAVDASQWAAADRLINKLLAKHPECINNIRDIYFSKLQEVDSTPDRDIIKHVGRHNMLCIKLAELNDYPEECGGKKNIDSPPQKNVKRRKKSKRDQDSSFFHSYRFRIFAALACWLLFIGYAVGLPLIIGRVFNVRIGDGWDILSFLGLGGLLLGNLSLCFKLDKYDDFPESLAGTIFFSSLIFGFLGIFRWIELCC